MKNTIIFFSAAMLIATPKTHAKSTEFAPEVVPKAAYEQVIVPLSVDETGVKVVQTATSTISIEVAPVKEKSLKEIATEMVEEKFGKGQFTSFDFIIQHESSWNPNAVNESSGACGLGQALPCSKMNDKTPVGQIKWVIDYISGRYGTPNNAKAFWLTHNWY